MATLSKSQLFGIFSLLAFIVFAFLVATIAASNSSQGAILSSGGVNWQIVTVDANARGNSSIAVDSNNYPHISYERDGSPHLLRYARWTGSQWVNEGVGSMDLGSANTSIALDSSDNAYISYAACNKFGCPAKYADRSSGSWSVTGTMDGYGSMAIDANDVVHISYKHGNVVGQTSLRYMYLDSGTWITSTVDTDPILNNSTSIAIDSNQYPHISYHKEDTLKYAFWNGSSWVTQPIDNVQGQYTSLALDSNDYPHIAYYDGDNKELEFAEWNGSSWDIQTVDSVDDVGKNASLALDSMDSPHISYYDAENQAIKYAYRINGTWQNITIEAQIGDGDVTSLVVDDNDRLHLVYYYYGGENDRALRYATSQIIIFDNSIYLPAIFDQ